MLSLRYQQCIRFSGPFIATLLCLADTNGSDRLQIDAGVASFLATTNVPGVDVKGKSTLLKATASIRRDGGLTVQRIDASLPTTSLATGMKLRDEHMRRFIFTTADGHEPDIRFTADEVHCPSPTSVHDLTCPISGLLRIRGLERHFEITLRIKEQSASAFHAEGDGIVKLTDYGIEPPSQLGVRVSNEVKLHLGFVARNAAKETDR